MIPTSSTQPESLDEGFGPAAQVLEEVGVDSTALARAREVAQLVVQLTGDLPLARAAMLHMAGRSGADAPVLNAGQRNRLDPASCKLASQLSRLGQFHLDAQWAEGRSLPAAQSETLRKMLLAVVGDPRLVVARLAEELVLIRHCREESPGRRRQLAMEVQELYAPLANRLGIWNLKWELEDLAFRELHPEAYQRIAQALNEKRRDRERYIEQVIEQLSGALQGAGMEAEVAGRPKHIYSIHRKMQRKQLAFDQLFDVRAVRIIVGTVADCYAALGVVHDLWPFIPEEFDDYIATPKENAYRSIHTAVHGPGGRSLEVQIRTREMQAQAELGVAAHWRYKEGGGDRRYDEKIQQVRHLLHGDSAGTEDDSLTRLSSGLFDDRVYAMTPKGEVVDLPRGGTPLDFAFHVHSDLGERCKGARINGRIAPLNQPVQSGDVVEIITGKQPAPSRDWLSSSSGFLASSRSRTKLRAYFRRLDEASSQPTARPTASEPQPASQPDSRPSALRSKTTQSQRSPVEIDGVGDLPITLARCCAPVRPQPIRGYLTLGRGVTIHRANCPALARMIRQKPQRQLQVDWTEGSGAKIASCLLIEAFDRRGLLRDISDTIAEDRLSIEGVSSNTDPKDRIARFEVRLTVHNVDELTRLQRRLGRIPNVFKVRRAR